MRLASIVWTYPHLVSTYRFRGGRACPVDGKQSGI